MKLIHQATLASVCMIGIAPAFAQDRKLTREQLPPSVLASVDRETKGSQIKGYGSEKENGKTNYEVETTAAGHTRDLSFSADGTLLEVEEEVAFDALPSPVQSALKTKAAGAAIKKVESLTKRGTLVAYEASTLRNGKKGEVQVGPQGETLKHAE